MYTSLSAAGKQLRAGHIFAPDGRTVIVAVNQGIKTGPQGGIADLDALFTLLGPQQPDAVMMHRGPAMQYTGHLAGRSALVLKLTNRTRFTGPIETQVASVEDASVLGADAVSMGFTMCDERENQSLELAARIAAQAQRAGIPMMVHAYPNGGMIPTDRQRTVENVGYAVRAAKEIGADVIKTFYTGDGASFARIVAIAAPCRLIISGGPKCATLRECFDMTWQGVQAGCAGVAYGRNIWQHQYPAAVLAGLKGIIHGGLTVDQALELAGDTAGCHLE